MGRSPVLILSFLLFPLILAACSGSGFQSSPQAFRSPSSEREEVALESLMSSSDPRASAKTFVLRLLRIRLRAQAWLEEFDAAVAAADGEIDIFTLPAYRHFLAARPLAERMENKIVAIYKEARAVIQGRPSGEAEEARHDKSLLVVAGIRDALKEIRANPAHRVLLHDLMVALKASFDDPTPAAAAPLSDSELPEAAAKAAPMLKKLAAELPETDDVKAEIEEEAAGHEAEERGPSSARISPAVGDSGNMMGFNFPKGTYALTYDDGPHASYTMQNLANLQANGVMASFFWIANNARQHPEIVKAVQAAGMSVENHSYMHADLTSARDFARLHTNLDREINGATEELTRNYGVKPKFFRCPYAAGMKNLNIRTMIAKQEMIHVKWNIDSADWQDKNPVSVLARVEQQMRANGRGIVLFHDIQPGTIMASRNLMIRTKGKVRWITIPQITDELNK